jgi:hypothetical protein
MKADLKKKLIIGGSVAVVVGIGYVIYKRIKKAKADAQTQMLLETEPITPVEVVPSTKITRPKELADNNSVLAFQIYANKNGTQLAEDGLYGKKTDGAWKLLGASYIKKLNGITKGNLKVVYSRFFPKGESFGNIVQAYFGDKMVASFGDDGTISIIDQKTMTNYATGTYANGGRKVNITTGVKSGQTFETSNVYTTLANIVK